MIEFMYACACALVLVQSASCTTVPGVRTHARRARALPGTPGRLAEYRGLVTQVVPDPFEDGVMDLDSRDISGSEEPDGSRFAADGERAAYDRAGKADAE